MLCLKAFLLIALITIVFNLKNAVTESLIPEPESELETHGGSGIERMVSQDNAAGAGADDLKSVEEEGDDDDDADTNDDDEDADNEDGEDDDLGDDEDGGDDDDDDENSPNADSVGLVQLKEEGDESEEQEDNAQADDDDDDQTKAFYNFATGEEVSKKEAKKVALLTSDEQREQFQLLYQANVPGPTLPIVLRFSDSESQTCSAGKNNLFFKIDICFERQKQCPKGMAICYQGKLDPKYDANLNPSYGMPNINLEELSLCQPGPENKPDSWNIWNNKELHSIVIKSDINGHVQISSSFGKALPPIELDFGKGKKQCIEFMVGTPINMYGQLSYDQMSAEDFGFPWSNERFFDMFKAQVINGMPYRDFMVKTAAIDMLRHFNLKKPEALFALVSSEGCDMELRIQGDNLENCLDNECTMQSKLNSNSKGAEKKKLYKQNFALENLVAIRKPELIPSSYGNLIQLEKENTVAARDRAFVTTTGQEVQFSILTKDKTPPEFFVFFPRLPGCAITKHPEENMFVLAYNGRPDCYLRFGWGERKLFFFSDVGPNSEILTMKDVKIVFEANRVYGYNQHRDKKMLASVYCELEYEELKKADRLEGVADFPFLWKFIINPVKNSVMVPRSEQPTCDIGIMLYLDSMVLVLKDNQKGIMHSQEDPPSSGEEEN